MTKFLLLRQLDVWQRRAASQATDERFEELFDELKEEWTMRLDLTALETSCVRNKATSKSRKKVREYRRSN